jgi:hypothetical protein
MTCRLPAGSPMWRQSHVHGLVHDVETHIRRIAYPLAVQRRKVPREGRLPVARHSVEGDGVVGRLEVKVLATIFFSEGTRIGNQINTT